MPFRTSTQMCPRSSMNKRVGYVTSLFATILLNGADSTSPEASASQLHTARAGACSVVLRDGNVLITGGSGAAGPLASVEIYNSKLGSREAAPMANGRYNHVCALLADGRVLVGGGTTHGN